MYAILETLIDALRLMTFQPPGRQKHGSGSHAASGACEAAAATDHSGAPRPLIHADFNSKLLP